MIIARALRRQLTVTVILAVAAQGCGGVTGPPALSRAERATLEAARFDIKVGVQGQRRVKGDEDAWSRDLFIAAMQERMIFREIAPVGAYTSPPDVVATVKRTVDGDAPLPFVTFLTLGLVPTIATDMQRWEVAFVAPRTGRP